MSVALIFALSNPQYDKRLFIELPVQYMKIPFSEHWKNMRRTSCIQKLFFCFDIQNNLVYNDKDLTVPHHATYLQCLGHN